MWQNHSWLSAPRQQERGAALAVALVFLLVLTLIGVTAMRTTILEERMAGAMRDYNLAFQATEHALRVGEAEIESSSVLSGLLSRPHVYATGTAPDPFTATTWTTCQPAPGPTGLASPPCYFIEHLGTIATATPGAEINIGGYGQSAGGGTVSGFRVVARATGGTGFAEVILESRYGKRF